MPKVGKKNFSYTTKGKAAAKRYAKKTGQKIKRAEHGADRGRNTKKGY